MNQLSRNSNYGNIFGIIIAFIGIIILFQVLLYIAGTTATQTDDLIVITTQAILAEVPILTIPLPFAGGWGIILTAGGTIILSMGGKKQRII